MFQTLNPKPYTHRLEEKYGAMHTLVCGDFNSLPGTHVYNYLSRKAGAL